MILVNIVQLQRSLNYVTLQTARYLFGRDIALKRVHKQVIVSRYFLVTEEKTFKGELLFLMSINVNYLIMFRIKRSGF